MTLGATAAQAAGLAINRQNPTESLPYDQLRREYVSTASACGERAGKQRRGDSKERAAPAAINAAPVGSIIARTTASTALPSGELLLGMSA
jgi:hypothetical protein